MSRLKVVGTFNLIGTIPGDLHNSLVRAVGSVSEACFFDQAGKPLKTEVVGVDKSMASKLREFQWSVRQNYCPLSDCDFNVDLAIPKHRVLIEIEKGKDSILPKSIPFMKAILVERENTKQENLIEAEQTHQAAMLLEARQANVTSGKAYIISILAVGISLVAIAVSLNN